MLAAADSFGGYGRYGSRGIFSLAAHAADRVITWGIVIVLVLLCAFAGYGLWDSWRVLNGGAELAKPTDAQSFKELMAINPDVCAWLTVDNTNIDYPVVQGKDNYEYLAKDAKGAYAAAGSIFLDVNSDRSFSGPYELLYGHHMEYGKMFGDLDKFLDKDFFDANDSAQLMLPDRTLKLHIVAVMTADAYDSHIFGTPITSQKMPSFASYVEQHARYQREGELSANDHVIALSTCASSGADARTVLICTVSGEQALSS